MDLKKLEAMMQETSGKPGMLAKKVARGGSKVTRVKAKLRDAKSKMKGMAKGAARSMVKGKIPMTKTTKITRSVY